LADEKFYILFGAMNTKDERKGFKFLIESLKSLTAETDSLKNSIEVLIFGKTDNKNLSEIPFKCHYFGQFKRVEQIVDCYNSANIFIAPSLQDNLPNTVLESLSCGTPVVSFNVGGMSDMIEHLKNGYLAEANSVTDLKNGIKWFLENRVNPDQLKFNSREKVVKNFSQEVVAKKYKELYTSLIY
ncbi:MAG: accessory Sec system glycosyltransferase Asp1, partial [Ignavibacteriaceae bacterium]|nr:accessory Sec system glycosyltransferase Asp1 [Ignavibacteriaceae bacterium]